MLAYFQETFHYWYVRFATIPFKPCLIKDFVNILIYAKLYERFASIFYFKYEHFPIRNILKQKQKSSRILF